eukprot:jgi/Ulvmu1/7933/UM004_0166.1
MCDAPEPAPTPLLGDTSVPDTRQPLPTGAVVVSERVRSNSDDTVAQYLMAPACRLRPLRAPAPAASMVSAYRPCRQVQVPASVCAAAVPPHGHLAHTPLRRHSAGRRGTAAWQSTDAPRTLLPAAARVGVTLAVHIDMDVDGATRSEFESAADAAALFTEALPPHPRFGDNSFADVFGSVPDAPMAALSYDAGAPQSSEYAHVITSFTTIWDALEDTPYSASLRQHALLGQPGQMLASDDVPASAVGAGGAHADEAFELHAWRFDDDYDGATGDVAG